MDKRKDKLFSAGVSALSRISRPSLHGYLCPLCLKLFDDAAELTEEHAPQKVLGGKAICLTCRSCNNTAGHSIDSAVSREKVHNKLLAADGTPTRVTVAHGDITLRSEISQSSDFIEIRLLQGQNDPRVEAKLRTIFESGNTDGLDFDITTFGGFRRRDADVGYLKSAYLGAFAKFGYSWIFGTDSSPIRNQIKDPLIETLPICRIAFDTTATEGPQDGFYFMKDPFSAIMAALRPYGVLLPWPGGPSPTEISRWVVAQRAVSPSGRLNFVGFAPWPRTSDFVLDRQ